MILAVGNFPSCTTSRSVSECQSDPFWQKRSANPRCKTSLSLKTCSHFQENFHLELLRVPVDPRCQNHQSRVHYNVQSCLVKKSQFLESLPICGCVLGRCLQITPHPLRTRRKQIFFVVNKGGDDENDDKVKTRREGELEFCPPSKKPRSRKSVETANESGYVIKVSKELMSVFQYVEKVKRARLRELSETLRQVAYACLFLSCVKGIVNPVVEVFKTQPPAWSKLIMVLGAFDAFAITYLALKASQPLERLSSLATECEDEINMMGSIEKEEEYMLALALDLVRLFRRLRNLALGTAVTQFAHILHSMLKLKKSYPHFASHIIKVVNTWLSTPWV